MILQRSVVLMAALLNALSAQPANPGAAEGAAIIERARAAALEYSNGLENFACTRVMTRSADDSTTGTHYKQLETQEGDLSYVNQKEGYLPRKVNGQTTGLDKRVKKGYFIPGGEFGDYLLKTFDPKANAEFTFDRSESSADRQSYVFRYNVTRATTTFGIYADGENYRLAHHGFVVVDCETGAVARFHLESETPTVVFKGHKIVIGNTLDVRYSLSSIGEKQFLLPVDATEVNRFHKRLTKIEIQFRQYRKYDSTSTVSLGPDKWRLRATTSATMHADMRQPGLLRRVSGASVRFQEIGLGAAANAERHSHARAAGVIHEMKVCGSSQDEG